MARHAKLFTHYHKDGSVRADLTRLFGTRWFEKLMSALGTKRTFRGPNANVRNKLSRGSFTAAYLLAQTLPSL